MKRRPSRICPKCLTWRLSLHRDHILPKWKGGLDEPSNWQLICANCHEDKTREDLKGRPQTPGHNTNRGPVQLNGRARRQGFPTIEAMDDAVVAAYQVLPSSQRIKKQFKCSSPVILEHIKRWEQRTGNVVIRSKGGAPWHS